MKRTMGSGLLAVALLAGSGAPGTAQEAQDFLAVGEMAPDVEFTGATRHGILQEPVRLSEYRGETLVLAFFYRAMTPG
jgi:peroxiredoxin Q/BCP